VTTRARDAGPLGREIEHTADLGLEIEAPTLAALFERAGLAMLGLALDVAPLAAREHRQLSVTADGVEELLHDWLQTLLVQLQLDGFAACELDVAHVDERTVRGTATGERIDLARHPIHTELKGVTYHELAVHRRPTGWWARVIVDV